MIELLVYGTPGPQGSKTAFIRGGKPIITEGGSKKGRDGHAAWRQAVATAARDYQEKNESPTLTAALCVELRFVFDRPKSIPKKRLWPAVKPDADKLARAVLDAIKGTLIKDDALVVWLVVSKHYASPVEPPHARIRIREMDALNYGMSR